jgi:Raf kinase inhibitor-like YbhB/YbcL family protein
MRITLLLTCLATAALASTATAAPFKLTSPDFKEGGTLSDKAVFNSFGCSGQNISPELDWVNPPAGTKSFALMVYDPDAPTGSGWWHWVVYNIPADAKQLASGAGAADGKSVPKGAAQGNTDFGTPGYGGPCPPPGSGNHHYVFTLFALKVDKLDLPANATAAFVGFNVNANALGKAKLTGLYGRKK